jgi:uncharacterized protein (DUF2062 family)
MIKRYILHHIAKMHELLDAKDAPHSVAGGTSIGVFFSFLPIFGFKTLAAMGASLATRCSVVASVIGVSLHDIFLPLWPMILRFQFQVGYWILSHPHHLPPPLTRGVFRVAVIFQWDSFVTIGLPVMVGGIVFGAPCALVTYGSVLVIMQRRAAKRRAKEKHGALRDKAWEQP